MDVVSNATSFTSPLAHADLPISPLDNGFVARILDGINGWSILLTTILLLVTYDQCTPYRKEKDCSELTSKQVVTNGKNRALLAQHGRSHSWAHSWSR